MNWYKKTKYSSISFWIEGSDKISQPMHALDVCGDIHKFIWYVLGIGEEMGLGYNDIEPDTSETDYNDPLGRINVYINPNIKEKSMKYIVNQYNQHRLGDIKLDFLGINKSGARNSDVARIKISENNTTQFEEIPEMNMANGNAFAVFQMLANEGLPINPSEYAGEINIDQLEIIINKLGQEEYLMQPYIKEPTEEEGEGGAKMYDGGRDYDRLKGYLSGLEQMINYVKTNNLPSRVINYG